MSAHPETTSSGSAAIGAALIAFGVLNAVLYAALLPLWEGFDEPFHYAYVEQLSEHREFPELGRTPLSGEVWTSLHLAPASAVVKANLPWVTTFEEYFRMTPGERERRRAQLEGVSRMTGSPNGLNYEAHQAPLAYVVLAFADEAWSSSNLLTRVWRLRLICGVLASVATAVFLFALAKRLRLSAPFRASLVFVVLSSQMFYATTAHVANDWLAVPLMVLLMERSVALRERPMIGNVLAASATLAAGLLTKAYFLAMVLLPAVILLSLIARRRLPWYGGVLFAGLIAACCGPWYARNLRLYRNLSGMQEAAHGAKWFEIAASFFRVPWALSLKQMAFASLWTGNNSFTGFSVVTLSAMLAGFAAAAAMYAIWCVQRGMRLPGGEAIVLSGCALYGCALLYSTTLSFWFTKGTSIAASPWYAEPLVPILLALPFSGLARFGRLGRAVVIWLIWCSAWVISISYWAKLIPLYGGYSGERATPLRLLAWYGSPSSKIAGKLSATAMTGPALIFALAAAVTAGAAGLAGLLTIQHVRQGRRQVPALRGRDAIM